MLKALFIIWIFHIYYHWSTYIVTLTIGIGKAVPDLMSYLYKDVEDTRVLISTSSNWGKTEQESDELVTEEQRCATLAEKFRPYAKFCGSPVMTAFQSFIIFYLLELWYLVVLLRILVRNEVASLERDKSDVEQKLRDTERELKQAAENLAQVHSKLPIEHFPAQKQSSFHERPQRQLSNIRLPMLNVNSAKEVEQAMATTPSVRQSQFNLSAASSVPSLKRDLTVPVLKVPTVSLSRPSTPTLSLPKVTQLQQRIVHALSLQQLL